MPEALPDLALLPDLPRDGERPVFEAPWQAQAFAMAHELQAAGHFSWTEWSEALGRAIAAAKARGDPDRGDTYYEHWLACLESMLASKDLLTPAALAQRRQRLRREHEQAHHADHRHDGHAGEASEHVAQVERQLRGPGSRWSIGILGAIGEFGYDAGEPAAIDTTGAIKTVVTPRGAIAVHLVDDVRCIAHESGEEGGGEALSFCLPERAALLPVHDVPTELGPDVDAITTDKRSHRLFDLGLGSPYLQFCIRTSDPELLAVLRGSLASSLLDPTSVARSELLRRSPHRVIVSRLGRIEVYQAIPSAAGDAASLQGPHTHLLPELLETRRTHPEALPIPEAWIPCLTLYPAR